MSASRSWRAILFRGGTLLALLGVVGCEDPTVPRKPPELTAINVFLVLNPDETIQPLLAYPVDGASQIQNMKGEVALGSTVLVSQPAAEQAWVCADRYGRLGGAGYPHCIDFRFSPQFGATYRVTVSGEGYATASARVTVPGDFQVRAVSAPGDPPGTEELEVHWTPSKGVYRYLVALRPETAPRCVQIQGCDQGWYAVTTDTVLRTRVPAEELAGSEGAWFLDVYSMDRAVFEYLTTGTSGNLFPVPPAQNVEGGYGAVGAWVRRSHPIQ